MKCEVMGIVNVTPDSFSDGGKFYSPEEAIRRAENLIDEGASIIDFGGESTRPGATPISWQEEWSRLEKVIATVAKKSRVAISVDTYHPETASRALDAGAKIINCVYRDSTLELAKIVATRDNAELVFPYRANDDLSRELLAKVQALGIASSRLYLDPMIGFDTTRDEDLAILKSLRDIASVGRLLVGASRKRIVKKLTGEKVTGKNLGGNLAIALFAAQSLASVVRVHDVRETVQALRVFETLSC